MLLWFTHGTVRPMATAGHAYEARRQSMGTTKLDELVLAVGALSEEEYSQFRQWFLERDWETWDRQIDADSESGRLGFLVREAQEARNSGKLRSL
jgi:hypothetical protein